MSYVTDETVWPESVAFDDSVKNVISLFYQLADDNSAQAGPRMASEVFTPDGKFIAGSGAFQGSEGNKKLLCSGRSTVRPVLK